MAKEESPGPRRVGVPDARYSEPLWLRLRNHPGFNVHVDAPAQLAIRLRQHSLHAAILSPIDYARDYSMYRIVPRVAVASKGESKTVHLQFTQGLRTIKAIGVDPRSASEIVLARLILAEKYDILPTFVPAPPGSAPSRTDARLIVGDQPALTGGEDTIDLVDEWTDMTGLPFVHGTWVSRENDLTVTDMNHIIAAVDDSGKANSFMYDLDDETMAGLTEFIRMAYYHGVLNDIADVKLHTLEPAPPSDADGAKTLPVG